MKKKALLLAAALAGAATHAGTQPLSAPEGNDSRKADTAEQKKSESAMKKAIDKSKIIECLKSIRKDPSTVMFHSAMCYDMVMPPPDTSFNCPNCGFSTPYPSQSFSGKVADWLPSIERILKQSPAEIKVDYRGFCSKCRSENHQQARLKFVTSCIDCGKEFAWSVDNDRELEQISLLALKFPITEVNQGEKGSQKIAPENLAKFFAERYFCPDCRKRNQMDW